MKVGMNIMSVGATQPLYFLTS